MPGNYIKHKMETKARNFQRPRQLKTVPLKSWRDRTSCKIPTDYNSGTGKDSQVMACIRINWELVAMKILELHHRNSIGWGESQGSHFKQSSKEIQM